MTGGAAGVDLGATVLEARGVRVVRDGKVLLRDVHVAAHAGDVVGVLGPSGAGKSTLFRALVGELTPDAGAVLLNGRDVTREPLWQRARRGVGYIPQSASVLWELSVRENLETFQRVVFGHTRKVGPAAEAAAEQVGLTSRLGIRAGDLSAGERRRLEFARAITRSPKALICDEPFAGVDPQGAGRLGDLLRALADTGVAVLLADHHVEEALRVCSRAILLLDGAVATEAEPSSFRRHPLVEGRYLGTLRASASLVPPRPGAPSVPGASVVAAASVVPGAPLERSDSEVPPGPDDPRPTS